MPASPSTARAMNDRLALRLLQQQGPLTATQLKQHTGLSRPTVADLVDRLAASGLIEVVGEAGAERRGPNAKLYGIVADRAHLAALDVRTEGVSVLVSDLVGRVLGEASVPIGGDTGTGHAVEQAVALVERVAKEAGADRLHTVGIGAPGLIDPATGELRDSGGLPAWHRRLVAALQERLPAARVTVENETNLAALAEQRDGAARDRDTFVLLWLGIGTGAAVVLDGHLRRGASGGTGEIGFLPVPWTRGLPSATDCEGGFHSLASSAAIAELAERHGVTAPAGTEEPLGAGLVRAAVEAVAAGGAGTGAGDAGAGPGGGARTGGADVGSAGAGSAEGAEGGGAGDAEGGAGAFLDALADRVALGVASVVAVLDPGCVVLGGEVGRAGGEELAGRVEERIRRMAPLPTEVRAGVLGGAAVLRGALLTAREAAQEELFSPLDR
ncbi:transcriptional regulator [Streptomyces longwoodensis]|uniref:Transcriptional regulator n=1 Tax=Streptomyces longwoodensis TaxID=68231 RepID=A0A101QVN0_9ACTN|nr:ROK family transcriptional regulator [Streptomyces longwoodensis]KUN36813.1 transcriptional regulator [Streptomyces longwoodensis]